MTDQHQIVIEAETVLNDKEKAALTRWLNEKMSRWAELETELKPLKREASSLKKEVKDRAENLNIEKYRHGGALLYSYQRSYKPKFEDIAEELAETPEQQAFVELVKAEVDKRAEQKDIKSLKLSA